MAYGLFNMATGNPHASYDRWLKDKETTIDLYLPNRPYAKFKNTIGGINLYNGPDTKGTTIINLSAGKLREIIIAFTDRFNDNFASD